MSSQRALRLVKGVAGLVSLPEVCLKVNALINDPSCSAKRLGAVIGQDPALTTRLLRIANSPYFGLRARVDTVSRAVTVLGIRELQFLVLATSVTRSFDRLPNTLIDMDAFWRHSIYCAVVARLVARRCHVLHHERLFVAGLLHDIGLLIMFNKIPELCRVMISRSSRQDLTLVEAERDVFDIDHAEVGRELLMLWQLPPSLAEAVGCHHRLEQAADSLLDAAIVHIADGVAPPLFGTDSTIQEGLPINDFALEIVGVGRDELPEIKMEAEQHFAEIARFIMPEKYEKTAC